MQTGPGSALFAKAKMKSRDNRGRFAKTIPLGKMSTEALARWKTLRRDLSPLLDRWRFENCTEVCMIHGWAGYIFALQVEKCLVWCC
jgi:hypothetical protein